MARILEALSRTPGTPGPSSSSVARAEATLPACVRAVAPAPAPAAVEVGVSAVTDLHYIEVGSGPTTGSSSVLPVAPPPLEPAPLAPVVMTPPPPALEVGSITLHEIGGVAGRQPVASRLAPGLVAYHQPEHEVARQYRGLLEAILKGAEAPLSGQGTLLLFSNMTAGADNAAVVLNLALTQARRAGSPLRSVVVDAGGAGDVHRQLGLSASPGLCEVISGAVPLNRAVRQTGVQYCEVLCAGETGKPCLAVRSLIATLAQLRKRFDLVYVDAPSWHGQPGLVELAACCDAVYLVTPRGPDHETLALVETLPGLGVPLRGCITVV